MIDVVGGLFVTDGKFMICRRPKNKARGLLWEFVGGKVEKGETKEEALVRECREELDVDVKVGDEYISLDYHYPDIDITLTVFYSTIIGGEVKLLEHEDMKYISPDEIDDFEFCPADRDVLEKIKNFGFDA